MDNHADPSRSATLHCPDPTLHDAIAGALRRIGVEVRASGTDLVQPLAVLVHVMSGPTAHAFEALSGGDYADQLEAGLTGAFNDLQRGVAAMRATGDGGSVVFVAPHRVEHRSFDAGRHGLRLLTRAAALELGPEGIRVNVVLPGGDATNPMGHPVTPEDIAASVAFVASARACFMTGADLVVDGGAGLV